MNTTGYGPRRLAMLSPAALPQRSTPNGRKPIMGREGLFLPDEPLGEGQQADITSPLYRQTERPLGGCGIASDSPGENPSSFREVILQQFNILEGNFLEPVQLGSFPAGNDDAVSQPPFSSGSFSLASASASASRHVRFYPSLSFWAREPSVFKVSKSVNSFSTSSTETLIHFRTLSSMRKLFSKALRASGALSR